MKTAYIKKLLQRVITDLETNNANLQKHVDDGEVLKVMVNLAIKNNKIDVERLREIIDLLERAGE